MRSVKRLLMVLAVSTILLTVSSAIAMSIPSGEFVADEYTVGLWHLNEGTGATTADASSYGNDGTIYGASWVNGKSGKALSFDGSDDYVNVADDPSLDLGSDGLKIELWFKTSKTGGSEYWRGLVNKGGYAIDDGYALLIMDGGPHDGKVYFTVWRGFKTGDWQSLNIVTESAYNDGQWHYVEAVLDRVGNEARLYIDGESVGTDDATDFGSVENSYSLEIGRRYYKQGPRYENFQGVIDEVHISKITLKQAIPATVDIDPDTLNLKSKGKWITAYIELPEDCDVNDINVDTMMLNDIVSAEPRPTDVGDYDDDGIPDLMVKFDRSDVQAILEVGNEVEVTVTGEAAGTPFEGSDTIKVISKGK